LFSVLREYLIAIRVAEALENLLKRVEHAIVGRGEQANRIIAAKHHSISTERFESDIDERTQIISLPRAPVCLGDQTGELAVDVWVARQWCESVRPFFDFVAC